MSVLVWGKNKPILQDEVVRERDAHLFVSVSLRAGFVDNSLTIVVNAMNRRETDRQPFDRLLTAETISLNGGQDTNPSRAFFLFCHISTTRLEGASTSLT